MSWGFDSGAGKRDTRLLLCMCIICPCYIKNENPPPETPIILHDTLENCSFGNNITIEVKHLTVSTRRLSKNCVFKYSWTLGNKLWNNEEHKEVKHKTLAKKIDPFTTPLADNGSRAIVVEPPQFV